MPLFHRFNFYKDCFRLELPTFVIFAMVVSRRGESVKIVNGLSVEAGWQYPPSAELFK